ncbi:MAG: hypothetical protein CMJ40_06650 [Phycisphaerae bacterium]|nr:hypothetical protein [Phycisphaerae bacterium]
MVGTANADFQGIEWDVVNNSEFGTTFRVYAMMDPGDRLDAVAGNSSQPLSFSSQGDFYQNVNGGPTSKEINSNFFPFVPSLEWDSYVTVGALYQDGFPFGENNLNNVGIDWGSFESGADLYTDNGTYFVTPDQQQGQAIEVQTNAGNGYGVLIAQLTVSYPRALFSGLLQGKDANGDTWQASVNDAVIGQLTPPAPGALAVLAIAGFAGPRRRRG